MMLGAHAFGKLTGCRSEKPLAGDYVGSEVVVGASVVGVTVGGSDGALLGDWVGNLVGAMLGLAE